jgi:hypothetical protein
LTPFVIGFRRSRATCFEMNYLDKLWDGLAELSQDFAGFAP